MTAPLVRRVKSVYFIHQPMKLSPGASLAMVALCLCLSFHEVQASDVILDSSIKPVDAMPLGRIGQYTRAVHFTQQPDVGGVCGDDAVGNCLEDEEFRRIANAGGQRGIDFPGGNGGEIRTVVRRLPGGG